MGLVLWVLMTLLVLIQAYHVVHFWDLHLIQVWRLEVVCPFAWVHWSEEICYEVIGQFL